MKSTVLAAARTLSTFKPKDYGPGPNKIVAGDEKLGYFGQMAMTELVTSPVLASLAGYTEGTVSSSGNAWLKVIDNGKVLYVAKTPLRNRVTQFGMDQVGILKGKEITLGTRKLKIRLLLGGNSDQPTEGGREWNRIMYGLCATRPSGSKALANFSEAELMMNGNLDGRASWCQEKVNGNGNGVIRGHSGVQSFGGGQNIGSNGVVFGWRPVLELIPNS